VSGESEVIEHLRKHRVALVVLDADRGRGESWRSKERDGSGSEPVWIAIARDTGAARVRSLLEAGAFDVVGKPVERSALELAVHRALRQRGVLDELHRLREETGHREAGSALIGHSDAMENVRARLRALAGRDDAVWFAGEEGTGRELAARTLHAWSRRKEGPFVVVPCAGLSDAEWAARWRENASGDGQFDRARTGSILLKQLPRLTPSQQESLLVRWDRVDRGAQRPRMLASSSMVPAQAIDEGRLLAEVGRRFASEVVALPPLRQRREDVPLLARHFLGQLCRINELPPVELSPAARDALAGYGWPGNVRELRTVVEQSLILVQGGALQLHDLPERIRAVAPTDEAVTGSLASRAFRDAKRDVVESFERAYLTELLERHDGNVTAASQHAGMLRSALQRLLRKYSIRSAEFRRSRRARSERQPLGPRPE
jgi:DNA-binding NtrC family response regulator